MYLHMHSFHLMDPSIDLMDTLHPLKYLLTEISHLCSNLSIFFPDHEAFVETTLGVEWQQSLCAIP